MPRINKTLTTVAAIVAAIVVVFIVLVYYHGHDPATGASPKCMFKLITGYDCPGCGSQRALHAILNGDVGRAWAFNPFVFFAVPVGLFYIIVEGCRRRWPRLHAAAIHPVVVSIILIAVIAYSILRNM